MYPMARELDYPVWKRFLHGLSYYPNKEEFGEMWGEAMLYDSSITFAASGKVHKCSVIDGYMERSIRKWVLWISFYNIKFK